MFGCDFSGGVGFDFCLKVGFRRDEFLLGLDLEVLQCMLVNVVRFVELFLSDQFHHQAVHVLFLALGSFLHVGVSGVVGDENVDGTRPLTSGSPAPLDGPHCTRNRFVEHDEIGRRNVQSFFTDRGGHEHVDFTAAEPIQLGELLLLRHPFLRTSGGLTDEGICLHGIGVVEEMNQAFNGISVFREDEDLTLRFCLEFFSHQSCYKGRLGMKLLDFPQCKTKLVDDREGQHSVRFAPGPPLFFGPVEKRSSNACALGLHQVHQNVNPAQVCNTASRIVASHIPLLNGSARALLGALDVVGSDVGLGRHEPLTLEMCNLVVEVCSKWSEEGEERFGKVETVRVNVHVHVVSAEQGFVSLAQVKVVGIEVGSHLVDVAEG